MTVTDLPGPLPPPAVAADVLAAGAPADERESRLDAGAASLSGGGTRSIFLHERFLAAVAAALMTAGLVAIVLGWHGASGSVLVTEQVPYLISGGLLGVALATVGALTYFTYWLTILVRDNRRHHQELVAALREERTRDHEALLAAMRELTATERRPVRRAPRGS